MEKSEEVKKLWEPYLIKDNNLTMLGTLCVLCFGIAMSLHPILIIIEKLFSGIAMLLHPILIIIEKLFSGIAMLLHPILIIIEKLFRKHNDWIEYNKYVNEVLGNDKK